MKTALVIVAVISLGFGAAMLVRHKRMTEQLNAAQASSGTLSNLVDEARLKADEAEKVSSLLRTNLSQREQELAAASNEVTKAQSEVKTVQAELKKRETEVAELQFQRDDMTLEMDELTASIDKLNVQIADTKKKLASAEGDRDFLVKQLEQLEADKAELVNRWSNLAALREQYAKLRDDAAISQRLEWMRRGIYIMNEKKGAEKLLAGPQIVAVSPENRLEVEVEQNGAARILPGSTNAPPQR